MAAGHQIGFRSLDRELPPAQLPVEGKFPSWLAGGLLRIGPAKFEAGSQGYRHWFDGLAMLHRFGFADGEVTYTNRFLDSPAYRTARDTGTITYSEFATDPCRTLFKRVATAFLPPAFGNNANVNIIRSGDEFLALTETPLPVKFAPGTLDTLGVAPPAPGQLTTAHPHRAPASGELASYATHFGPRSTYQVYAQNGSGRRRVIARLAVRLPSYMHSFAITERYLVLVEFPFVVVPVAIPLLGRPFIANYRWRPGRGTRFQVLDLNTGSSRTYHGEPFFAFHHVNAYEHGNEIILDACAYDNADIIDALYLDRLRSQDARLPEARLRRYRIPLGGGDVTREPLPGITLELPRIDYGRRNGKPYRYAYGIGSADGSFPDRITKADLQDGTSASWSEPGTYPGEPIFARAPDTEQEDAGVLLSVVLDPDAGTSFLLALDATDLSEIGRARVPHHIPFGFHGGYFPQA
ncbi:MAG: carotenoid oxygenase family protein [Streptosporangiaceae bacterium]|jgi:beta,beta-carotene 9',10'-dioxygenase